MEKKGEHRQPADQVEDCEETKDVVAMAEQSLENGEPLAEDLVDRLIKYRLRNNCGTRHDRFRLLKEHYLCIPVEQLRAKDVQRLGQIRSYAVERDIQPWLDEIDDRLDAFVEALALPSDGKRSEEEKETQSTETIETIEAIEAIEEELRLNHRERALQQVLGVVSGASVGFIAFGPPGVVGGLVLGYVLTRGVGPLTSEPKDIFKYD